MRRVTKAALAAALCAALAPAIAAQAADDRATLRAGGGDRATAVRVAEALLARPLDVQLMRVRCERVGAQNYCGLTLSGVRFHRWISTAVFQAEVDLLVRGAFAADPAIVEVDVTAIVPGDAAHGAVESGDFARPAVATVFATSVTRAAARDTQTNAFWDAAFRRRLDNGTPG